MEIKYIWELDRGYGRFSNQLEALITKSVKLFGEEGRVGGYFCWADPQGRPLLTRWVGDGWNPEPSRARSEIFCREKAQRLASHPDHLTSWQSRDPDRDQWGGAIRLPEDWGILSFSSLPEAGDEISMLALGMVISRVSEDYAREIIQLTGNKFSHHLPVLVYTAS